MLITRAPRMQPTPIRLAAPGYTTFMQAHQWLAYQLSRVAMNTIVRGQTDLQLSPDDLVPGRRYVIAANHQSQLDPFLITSQFTPHLKGQLGTFRYFAYAGLFKIPAYRWGLFCLGGFPTRPFRQLPYGLEAARAYLGRGQVVVIFPEGQRALPGEIRPKSGVARMSADANIQVIPVHLQWTKHPKRSYQITIGHPLPPMQSEAAIMKAIYDLALPTSHK